MAGSKQDAKKEFSKVALPNGEDTLVVPSVMVGGSVEAVEVRAL